MTTVRRRLADCRGSSDVASMVFVVPLAFGVVMLFVFFGRQGVAAEGVTHASHVAAVAASQQRGSSAAQSAARQAAVETLSAAGTSCVGGPAVSVSADRWQPGRVITVTVTCSVQTGDLAAVGAPPRQLVASSRAVIDTYRGFSG